MASEEESEKGAAEEPEPEPGPPSGSATPSYDPRVHQPPHPNDRGDGTPTKKGGGSKGKGKGAKIRKSTKGNTADGSHRCSNCGADGATRCCSRCNNAWYCSKTTTNAAGKEINPCQKVRACRDDKKEIRALIVSTYPSPRRPIGSITSARAQPPSSAWQFRRSCAASLARRQMLATSA